MRIRLLLATATTAALLAGAALAQNAPAPQPDTAVNPPASAAGNASTNITSSNGLSSSGLSSSGSASSGSDAALVAPAAGAPTERAAIVDTQLITNGPVPDTPENRAKYGQPMSHAGKMTKARGN